MTKHTYGIPPDIQVYMRQLAVTEHPAQVGLREATDNVELSVMQSSPEMGNFLQLLVQMTGAKRCLEVGVYTGYSALSIALALPTDGLLYAFDVSEEWTSVGKPFWEQAGVAEKIHLTLQPASESLQSLLDDGQAGTFDFAFIDADKPGYITYYDQCMELLRPGGVIVLDNTLWEWKIADPSVTDADTEGLRKVNQHVLADDRVIQSIVPFGDGCTVIWKKK